MQIIIIRGPAGVGKSIVAKIVSKKIGATYVSYDEIMEKNNLDTIVEDGIPEKNFIKANKIILNSFDEGLLVLDGCFYRKGQIDHLISQSNDIKIFTLIAPLSECIKRNKERKFGMDEKDVSDVYNLVNKINIGKIINTIERTPEDVATLIADQLLDYKHLSK